MSVVASVLASRCSLDQVGTLHSFQDKKKHRWPTGHSPSTWTGVDHLSMSRPNLKFKIFGERGGSVISPCPSQIGNFKFLGRVGWSVIFLYPGQIWSLKFSVRVGEISHHFGSKQVFQPMEISPRWALGPCLLTGRKNEKGNLYAHQNGLFNFTVMMAPPWAILDLKWKKCLRVTWFLQIYWVTSPKPWGKFSITNYLLSRNTT